MMKLGKWIVTFMIIGLMMGGLHGTVNATSFTTDTRYSANDLRYLTAIIYCEARGESYAGKKAVGIVVMNRVESELFPNDVEEVIYQSGQFSPVGNGSLSVALSQYDYQKNSGKWDKTMLTCFQAAEEVLEGSREVDYMDNATNLEGYLFFSRYISGARLQLGNHMFR